MKIPQSRLTKSDLSEMALDAAIELDLERKPSSEDSAVVKFLSFIANGITDHNGVLYLKDESLMPVYSYALSNDQPHEYIGRKGLLERLTEIADENLGQADGREALRRFFLSVHEALATDLIDEHAKSATPHDGFRERVYSAQI
jgi:hypothetical protein